MLPQENVSASSTLAKLYATKGLSIVPKENTLLAQLVRSATPWGINSDRFDNQGEVYDFDSFVTGLGRETQFMTDSHIDDKKSQFDCELDAAVADLKAAITSHISLAKNVVAPVVADYAEKVQAALDAASVKPASEMLNVKLAQLPEPFSDASFANLFSDYDAVRPFIPERVLDLGQRSAEEIRAFLETGDDGVDKLIFNWILTKEPDFLVTIWNSFFTKGWADIRAEEVIAMNDFSALEVGTVCYLLGQKLFDKIPEDVKGVNLDTYKKLVAQVRDFGGQVVALKLNRIAEVTKGDLMVVDLIPSEKTIVVNAAVYNKWLDNGGEIEVLFGLLVSDERLFSVASINEVKERLLKAWRSWSLFQESSQINNRFNTFRSILESEFEASLINLTDLEKDVALKTPNLLDNIRKYFKEDLEDIRLTDIQDIYTVATRLIGKSRFFYTSGYDILSKMQTAQKFNPSITAREAGLLATIEYTVDYIADQMQLTNKL
jgi:hypothetical protein